jgi:hypothetical protein
MFLFPWGLMLHAKFSIMDYFLWNEIPTVLGNLVGGIAFTSLTLYATHVVTVPKRTAAPGPAVLAFPETSSRAGWATSGQSSRSQPVSS